MSENDEKKKEMLEQLNGEVDKKDPKPKANSDGHVLTEAEIKRQKLFDENEKKLLAKGYKRHDLLISVFKANFVGILLTLPFIALMVLGFLLKNGIPDFDGILAEKPVMSSLRLSLPWSTKRSTAGAGQPAPRTVRKISSSDSRKRILRLIAHASRRFRKKSISSVP